MTSTDNSVAAFHGSGRTRPPRRSAARVDRAARRSAAALLWLIILGVAVVVFWPGPPDVGGQSALRDSLEQAHANGLPFWINFELIQNLANVAMFVPVGLLGSLALYRRNYLIVPYAAAASGLIELIQLLLLPHRVAALEDIAANAAGALIGLLLSVPLLRRRLQRRRRYLQGRRSASDSRRRAARTARL